MKWQIITGEYPPQLGGVSDYTHQLAQALAAEAEDEICILAPQAKDKIHAVPPQFNRAPISIPGVCVHRLPQGFGLQWLRALKRALSKSLENETILVQYVPHGYGWKSMNLAFCLWLLRQRHRRVFVMFHEVAFPFRKGQPLRHQILAAMHRLMARIVLASARRSFTSIEPYRELLHGLAPRIQVELLRICSNVPFAVSRHAGVDHKFKTIGIFSNFWPELCSLLDPIVPAILAIPGIRISLIGPGEVFVEAIRARFSHLDDRIGTTGRLAAIEAGPHLQACDVLLQIYPDGAAGSRGTFIAALASGVPVVTNQGPQTEPLFKDRGAVALTDCEPDAIRRTIENLLEDDSRLRKIGIAGRKLYEEQFDISVTVAKLRRASMRACRVGVCTRPTDSSSL